MALYFYKYDGEKKHFLGTMQIFPQENSWELIASDEALQDFLEEDLRNGLLTLRRPKKQLSPKDEKEFIQRLLLRYSGSRFWCQQQEAE